MGYVNNRAPASAIAVAAPHSPANAETVKDSREIGDIEEKQKQVPESTILGEMTNIKGKSNTGTVNEASASGGGVGGLGGILGAIQGILNTVNQVKGIVDNAKNTFSGNSGSSNNSNDGKINIAVGNTTSVAAAITGLANNISSSNVGIGAQVTNAMRSVPSEQLQSDPFGKFFQKYSQICNNVEGTVSTAYGSSVQGEVLNDMNVNRNIKQILSLAKDYYQLTDSTQSNSSISGLAAASITAAASLQSNIQATQAAENEIIAYNQKVMALRGEYAKHQRKEDLKKLAFPEIENTTKNEYLEALEALRLVN